MKEITINGRKFNIVKMSAFDAIHFKLRIMELIAKHGINVSGSMMEAAGRAFTLLNREDHDEIIFRLLTTSRVQCMDNEMPLEDWGSLDATFGADNIADVYLVALECVKFSVAPVAEGLKKNIGLDISINIQSSARTLLSAWLKTLTPVSEQKSPSGE
ncbi:phage tail assembly chaperone [Buttiauxella sp. B2]|uniref:phage tail assembly chaperone n=1 Tax=Buttiauxella sp. B2 TaxID=2587812 RepID=UPI001CB8B61D|nr:hypothetical protein [Buttiauxella sp. B2]